METPKIGQIYFTGYITGLYDFDSKSFKIKRGTSKNGKKYQIFGLKVSSKDQEGNWTNGQPLKVMMFGDTKVEDKQQIGFIGRLTPDNYTNKEGKEIRGLSVMAFCDDMFEPANWDSKQESKEVKSTDDIDW